MVVEGLEDCGGSHIFGCQPIEDIEDCLRLILFLYTRRHLHSSRENLFI